MRQSGMRHGIQSQTSRNRVQNRNLLLDGNGDSPLVILTATTPASGNVIFDGAGSLYGATTLGGTGNNCTGNPSGTVYKLTPSGNDWRER